MSGYQYLLRFFNIRVLFSILCHSRYFTILCLSTFCQTRVVTFTVIWIQRNLSRPTFPAFRRTWLCRVSSRNLNSQLKLLHPGYDRWNQKMRLQLGNCLMHIWTNLTLSQSSSRMKKLDIGFYQEKASFGHTSLRFVHFVTNVHNCKGNVICYYAVLTLLNDWSGSCYENIDRLLFLLLSAVNGNRSCST